MGSRVVPAWSRPGSAAVADDEGWLSQGPPLPVYPVGYSGMPQPDVTGVMP
jgi:hypothetical protein